MRCDVSRKRNFGQRVPLVSDSFRVDNNINYKGRVTWSLPGWRVHRCVDNTRSLREGCKGGGEGSRGPSREHRGLITGFFDNDRYNIVVLRSEIYITMI